MQNHLSASQKMKIVMYQTVLYILYHIVKTRNSYLLIVFTNRIKSFGITKWLIDGSDFFTSNWIGILFANLSIALRNFKTYKTFALQSNRNRYTVNINTDLINLSGRQFWCVSLDHINFFSDKTFSNKENSYIHSYARFRQIRSLNPLQRIVINKICVLQCHIFTFLCCIRHG